MISKDLSLPDNPEKRIWNKFKINQVKLEGVEKFDKRFCVIFGAIAKFLFREGRLG